MTTAASAGCDVASVHSSRLPFQPLLEALPIDLQMARPDVSGPGAVAQAAEMLKVSTRTVHRLRVSGLSPWTADRLAVAAGFHPLAVWGEAWIRAIDVEASKRADGIGAAIEHR